MARITAAPSDGAAEVEVEEADIILLIGRTTAGVAMLEETEETRRASGVVGERTRNQPEGVVHLVLAGTGHQGPRHMVMGCRPHRQGMAIAMAHPRGASTHMGRHRHGPLGHEGLHPCPGTGVRHFPRPTCAGRTSTRIGHTTRGRHQEPMGCTAHME